jgi:hypothetical protein
MARYSEYRLVEAIVEKLKSIDDLVDLTRDGLSVEYTKEFKIGASTPNVKARTPFLGVSIVRTDPHNVSAPHTGWLRSRVKLCAFSRDDLVATLITDAVLGQVIYEMHGMSQNRAYLNFSNDHITNSATVFIRRDELEFNDGQDYYESTIHLEVIWLDRPCEGDSCCPSVDLTCPDQVDCSDCSE